MKRVAAVFAVVLTVMAVITEPAEAGQKACSKYSGRAYILCSEGGPQNMPNGWPVGKAHSGASSASGPCGMLSDTRRRYGGDNMEACERYMKDVYGSWSAAERHHRKHNWW